MQSILIRTNRVLSLPFQWKHSTRRLLYNLLRENPGLLSYTKRSKARSFPYFYPILHHTVKSYVVTYRSTVACTRTVGIAKFELRRFRASIRRTLPRAGDFACDGFNLQLKSEVRVSTNVNNKFSESVFGLLRVLPYYYDPRTPPFSSAVQIMVSKAGLGPREADGARVLGV
jgi:hypothetical protein